MSDHDDRPESETETAGAVPDDDGRKLTYAQALRARRAELMAMPSDRVMRGASLDASAAAATVEATARKLRPHRAALIAQFGAEARDLLDRLVVVARAAKQAQIEVAKTTRSADLSDLHAVVSKHYAFLRTEAESLVNRELLDPKELEPASTIAGYDALLDSTLILVSIFRDLLPAIAGETPVRDTHLDAAEAAAQHMTITMAHRDHGVERLAALDVRARALTALIRDYHDLRKKVTYIRWDEGDADEIAPSLWAARGKRRRRETAPSPEPIAPPIDPPEADDDDRGSQPPV